jgi:hypothetical protein
MIVLPDTHSDGIGLGVIIDAQLSTREHVARTAQPYFFHLRRLRSIRQQLGRYVTVKLLIALVFPRLVKGRRHGFEWGDKYLLMYPTLEKLGDKNIL